LTTVERIPVSKFNATCLAVLKRVKRTGQPVTVTRFGTPVAEVRPPRPAPTEAGWLGCMRGRAEIVGDVIGPALESDEWGALSRG
jgi:prevent-host-death family protein